MNKAKRKAKCKDILNSCGAVVTFIDDFNFLLECFQLNSRIWEQKAQGQRITSIETERSREYGTKHFVIIREDGTKTDISYIKCIDGISYRKEIKNACRNAIDETIIIPYKEKIVFPFICPILGTTLYSLEEVHIDHYDQTFDNMVKAWIEDRGGEKYLFQFLNETKDNSTITCFTSEAIKQDFIKYHNVHTNLRAVSKKANLTVLKRNEKGQKL